MSKYDPFCSLGGKQATGVIEPAGDAAVRVRELRHAVVAVEGIEIVHAYIHKYDPNRSFYLPCYLFP